MVRENSCMLDQFRLEEKLFPEKSFWENTTKSREHFKPVPEIASYERAQLICWQR